EKCPPQSPQKRERCPQNFFDPVLRRFAERSGLASLRYETELVDFVEHENGVTATVKNLQTGALETIEAAYLVGCDGGASTVRQKLDIPMEGPEALTYTTNVIFRCDGLEKLHRMEPGYRY